MIEGGNHESRKVIIERQPTPHEDMVLLHVRQQGKQIGALNASKEGEVMRMTSVRIDTERQGQGIGSQLVSTMEQIAKESDCEIIEGELTGYDLQQRPWLREFYERHGFTVSSTGTMDYKLIKRLEK